MKKKIFHCLVFGIAFSASFLSCRKESALSQAPVSAAGDDIIVQLPQHQIELDGSLSYDPEGGILQYDWSKISGPDYITISGKTSSKATLRFLTAGDYIFQLSVTDNNGLTDHDTVAVTILKYPAGYEIELTGLVFQFDRFENDLYVRTNPRPDIFFNYAIDLSTYLNAEVLFKLNNWTDWLTLASVSKYDPSIAVQYLYKINGDIMFVIRYPADPELEGKPVTIKIKFN